MKCGECENGYISRTYSETPGSGIGMTGDQAMNAAGRHHHWEKCEHCDEDGNLPPTPENYWRYLDDYPPCEIHIRSGLSFLTAHDGKQFTSLAKDTATALDDLLAQAMEDAE